MGATHPLFHRLQHKQGSVSDHQRKKPNSQLGEGFTRHHVVSMRLTWGLFVLFAEDASGAEADLSSLLGLFALQPQDGLRMTSSLPPSSRLPFSVDYGWQ